VEADEPPAPQEVRVIGSSPAPSETRVSGDEAREIPGNLGDPGRTLSALPGTAPMAAGTPYLYVRGAPPANTGLFVDGVRVPVLFHAGYGPSVISPSLVESVDLFPSAVPARYGGFAGAIMAEETRPPEGRVHGEAVARAYEANTLVEAPFADSRGAATAAFRYGYPQFVLAIASPDLQMGYWDYQSRATWSLGDRDRVGVFAFGSHDRLGQRGTEQFASDFHRVDARYDHDFGETGHLRAATTAGWSSQGASPVYMDDLMLAARVEGETRLGDPFLLHFGGQLQIDTYSLSAGAAAIAADQVPSGANPPPANLATGTYADIVWSPTRRVDVTVGGRFDVFESHRSDGSASGTVPTVEPRVGSRLKVAPGVLWLTSVGLAHQYPQLRVGTAPSTSVTVPGFAEGATYLQTSGQASTGFGLRLPAGLRLTATVFGSVTHHMSDLPDTCNEHITGTRQNPGQTTYICADQPVNGLAYGVELSLRRALTQEITGWLSYTLSRSIETYTEAGTSHTVLSQFDRTHVVSAIAAYDFGAGWRAGTRVTAYSGTPYLQFSGDQRAAPLGNYRFPAFFRADVRLEKRWRFDEERSLALIFEVQNVTGAAEQNRLDCGPNASGTGTTCTVASSPAVIIPSAGLEARF
jgi:hypothetical protein